MPAKTNCWVDPTLCLVIRSDKRRTLTGAGGWPFVAKGLPIVAPQPTGTLFGCGPKASQSIPHPQYAGPAGDEHLGTERLSPALCQPHSEANACVLGRIVTG